MGNTTTRMLKRIQSETPDFEATIEQVFVKFDRNGDGYLSMEEFEVLVDEVGAYLVDVIVKSESKSELQDMATSFISLTIKNEKKEQFDKIDSNQDGRLSLDELKDRVYYLIEQGATPCVSTSKPRQPSIFNRLTDESLYTGMYANHHEEALDLNDKRVEVHASGHAKNFNEAPVQKFGTQAERPVQFYCWNGLDKHAGPQKVSLANVRTFEQLVTKCTSMCSVSPQPLYLHTPDGKPVKRLDQLEDGQHYLIIQSGATYKSDRVPLALRDMLSNAPRRSSGDAPRRLSTDAPRRLSGPQVPEVATTVPRRPSGVAGSPNAEAGKVQRPVSVSSKRMDNMDEDLFANIPGSKGGGGRIFDRLTDTKTYTGMYANHFEQPIIHADPAVEKKGTGHAKNFDAQPVQKFGLQTEKPTQFYCWNGLDKHATAQKILMTNVRTMDQLVSKCTQACHVSPQPTFLHTPQGKPVKSLDDIVESQHYLVIQSGAKYNSDRLPTALKAML